MSFLEFLKNFDFFSGKVKIRSNNKIIPIPKDSTDKFKEGDSVLVLKEKKKEEK